MVKKKDKYSHPVKAALIKGGWWLLSRLPLRAIQALAIPVGKLVWRFSERERRVSQVNVELCFPHKTPWERDQLARGALIESARTLLEMGYIWMADKDRVLAKIQAVTGDAEPRSCLKQGQAVILLGPHLGQWEMLGLWTASLGPATSMFAPSRIRQVDNLVKKGRERTGNRLVPADVKGVAAQLKALKRGEVVGILPDQEPDKGQGGVFAPFYGCLR